MIVWGFVHFYYFFHRPKEYTVAGENRTGAISPEVANTLEAESVIHT